MKIPVLYQRIDEKNFEGYFYAYVPQWGITTHGYGIDGARTAIEDLIKIWISEKEDHGESIDLIEEAVLEYSEI
ncbi:MAG: type II toxin-antitoxin system HicB family antitoxin [Ignavibacteria bacterium]|nr:type II toxin-antitoxin system HicB family antitoxin [Ignavibacteria bacterium]